MLFTQGRGVLSPSNGKHVLKRAQSHRFEVNTLGNFARNFSILLKVFKGAHFRKSLTESERSHRFYLEKFLKLTEHVSYSIRYCKISLLIYSWSIELKSFKKVGVKFYYIFL